MFIDGLLDTKHRINFSKHSADNRAKYFIREKERVDSMRRESAREIKTRVKALEKENEAKDKEITRLNEAMRRYDSRTTSYPIKMDERIKIAALGDTHFGSMYDKIDELNNFYEIAIDEGVTTFLHAGDILDGHKIYNGQEFELRALGFANQIESVVKNYPKKQGVKTYFILGNHDTSFKKQSGVNVGNIIHNEREDLVYLGDDSAYITFETKRGEDRSYHLLHPDGGTPYAISYKLQKVIESYSGGQKPDALFMGHYHKMCYLPNYRNVQGFAVGCFQGQTPFMMRKGSAAHVGGWIVDDEYGRGVNKFGVTPVAYYEKNRKETKCRS